MEYWAKAHQLQSRQAALVAPTLTVGLCTQQQSSSWKLGGRGIPTQPTKAIWHIIAGGSQKVQILPTLDRKQPKWTSRHSDPRAQLSPGWGQNQNKPAVSWGLQMLQQKTEQTAEWLNTTTVSLAGMEVRQAAAALPSTDSQSSGGNISIIIWPAVALSGYAVSQQDANAQESHRLAATSSLSSDMPLTPTQLHPGDYKWTALRTVRWTVASLAVASPYQARSRHGAH